MAEITDRIPLNRTVIPVLETLIQECDACNAAAQSAQARLQTILTKIGIAHDIDPVKYTLDWDSKAFVPKAAPIPQE